MQNTQVVYSENFPLIFSFINQNNRHINESFKKNLLGGTLVADMYTKPPHISAPLPAHGALQYEAFTT